MVILASTDSSSSGFCSLAYTTKALSLRSPTITRNTFSISSSLNLSSCSKSRKAYTPSIGMNRTTTFAYDAAGRPVSRKQEDGSETTYTYDICGRLLSETNEDGGTTRYFHNRNGLLTKVVDADNYDATRDDGAGYTFTYDAFGRIKEVRDAYGQLCEGSEYDSAGRLKKQYDSVGLLVENRYDLGGRTAAIYDTEGASPVQTYTYDSMGNITGITDGEQNHTDFELDAWGRIVTLKAPDGSVETYTYDCAGNITSTTDGNGNTISYTYNSMQKLGSVTDQAGEADTFTYDGEGNLTVHTDRNGRKVTSTYGSFGLLLSENAEDGTFNHRKYDARGRLIENASNHVVYRYDYTKSGKVRTKYVNGKPALTYRYTKGGKVAGITDISGKTTEYAYDLNGNLSQVMEAGKVLVTYEYDEIGRIANICFANGVKTAYQYDAERNMASITTTGKDGSTLLSYSYRYDRNGNRVEKRDNRADKGSVQNGAAGATSYVYDNMQRLCEVTYPEAGKETYQYDAVGNRIRKQTESHTEGYTYDERNRLVQKQLWETGATVPADTTTYTYDAQGSLLSEQSTDLCKKYLYNDFHQCISTEVIRGREEEAERILQENRYDGEGLRFSLIENGKRTDFITNGWDNLAELDENGQVTKRIIRGMGIVASEDAEENADATEATGNTNGTTGNIIDATNAFAGTAYHYYHGNERMDVEYITDEAGKVVNGYTYDAFGAIITSSEKLQNRYTYNGEAFDKTTEQYYLRKRFYNPKLSRFIQEDEYRGDGLNLYAFCANNPVMYVDPSGYARAPKQTRAIYSLGDTPQAINDAKINRPNISNENAFIILDGSNANDLGAIKVLQDNGVDGIWYRNGRPDFTPVASFNVPIENMSTDRTGADGNYKQARVAIANEIMDANGNINVLIQKGVVNDYTSAHTKKQVQKFLRSDAVKTAIANNDYKSLEKCVRKYVEDNDLVVHEVNSSDVQVVPSDINGRYNHDGGVSDKANEERKATKCDG